MKTMMSLDGTIKRVSDEEASKLFNEEGFTLYNRPSISIDLTSSSLSATRKEMFKKLITNIKIKTLLQNNFQYIDNQL